MIKKLLLIFVMKMFMTAFVVISMMGLEGYYIYNVYMSLCAMFFSILMSVIIFNKLISPTDDK